MEGLSPLTYQSHILLEARNLLFILYMNYFNTLRKGLTVSQSAPQTLRRLCAQVHQPEVDGDGTIPSLPITQRKRTPFR